MDKMQKLEMMDKVLRELEDVKNSETAVLKKVAQIEAENINLGVGLLDKALPDIHGNVDNGVESVTDLIEKFQAHRDKFVKDNRLDAVEEIAS